MLKKLETISTRILFENPFWEYHLDKYELPGGEEADYHLVHTRGSTIIIPVDNEGRITLIRQFRYPNDAVSLEFPGGGIKPDITPGENARQELREETGYKAGSIKLIGQFNPFNGVTDEICNVFVAVDLEYTGVEPDESEEFEIIKIDKDEIIDKIKTGEIWDGMTLAAWSIYYFSENQ